MKKFIVGLLVVLGVFAFMSCSSSTYTEKTVTLKSTDGAVVTATATISADSNADAYVFVGGAYVSVTKNPYTGTYGTLTVVRKNSDWTLTYTGETTAGKETINVYIGTVTGAVMSATTGTIIANCESAVTPAPEPEDDPVELAIVSGKSTNVDSEKFEVDIDTDEHNIIGVFINEYYYGDFDTATITANLCDEDGIVVARLGITDTTGASDKVTYATTSLTGVDSVYGSIDGEIFEIKLASYYYLNGVRVIKDIYDSFKVEATVYGANYFAFDNVVNLSKTVATNSCNAYYKNEAGTFVKIASAFNYGSGSTPMVGELGYLTYNSGVMTFTQSAAGVIGTDSLEVYFGSDSNPSQYGHAAMVVRTLEAVETAMTAGVDVKTANYIYNGKVTKSLEKPAVTVYRKSGSTWTEWNGSVVTGYFVDEDNTAIGDVAYSQKVKGTVSVGVGAISVGEGSCQLIFGYKVEETFVPVDWLKLTHTF